MRVSILYINLLFILQLCGSNFIFRALNTSAERFSTKQNVEKIVKVKQQSSNHYNIDIESTDVDLDEELHSNDDCNDIDSTTILSWRDGSSYSKYFSFCDQNIYGSYFLKNNIYKLLLVDSTPIFLKIAVLRI